MRQPENDDDAQFLIGLRGYTLRHGSIFYVLDADEEQIVDCLIGPWTGTYLNAWHRLDRLGWPTVQAWGETHV